MVDVMSLQSTAFREVHKNTWLKVIMSSNKRKEKCWLVFCVHDDMEPFLEAYVDNKVAATHKPHWFISLSNTMHVTATICPQDNEYEFVVTLQNDVVRLVASSWHQMIDWVETLRRKLQEMHILSPKENVYTKLPETKTSISLLSTRDPTSPLPRPPVGPAALLPGVEPATVFSYDIDHINSSNISSSSNSGSGSSSSSSRHNSDSTNSPLPSSSSTPTTHYEHLFTAQSNRSKRAQRSASNCDRHDHRFINSETRQRSNSLSETSASYDGADSENGTTNTTTSTINSNGISTGGRLMLRAQQVLQLRKEIVHPSGVRLKLRRRCLLSALALVDVANGVWVAGWKQKEYPALYNALHIGDQLVSIEGFAVQKVQDAHRLLRNSNSGLYTDLVVKRVPYGKVFAIKREIDGQSLGLVQENNSAVLKDVPADSLAARSGLSQKAQTIDGLSFTNWVLTEINGRPLNLFFKGNEIKDRLNSIGKDISILVQPFDLIKQLKKQLKSMRKYKDYLLD